MSLIVVKVGGSLYDLPQLGTHLQGWLDRLAAPELLLVPGGGKSADLIWEMDCLHRLGEETSHWLAVRALTFNAYLLEALLPTSRVICTLDERHMLRDKGMVAILDVYHFLRDDETRPGRLPHHWAVTSDSIAARVAQVAGANELILLKSVTIPSGMNWREAAQLGQVDAFFPEMVQSALNGVHVRAVNFRSTCDDL